MVHSNYHKGTFYHPARLALAGNATANNSCVSICEGSYGCLLKRVESTIPRIIGTS